jgi:hypothetical protein
MNIKRTNPIGVMFLESRFGMFRDIKNEFLKESRSRINNQDAEKFVEENKDRVMVRMTVFDYNKNSKVLKLTKNIIRNCKLINIDSIKENINVSDLTFDSLVILLENDNFGLIKIDRVGSDFDFLYLKNLNNLEDVYFDTYSFLTKEFYFNNGCEDSNFVVQILAYLYYGEITTKILNPKVKTKINSFSSFLNNSKFPITYVDSLWKQRICVNGFVVRGHFRMQPFGEARSKRKLIWIEGFSKDGYNRKATKELA